MLLSDKSATKLEDTNAIQYAGSLRRNVFSQNYRKGISMILYDPLWKTMKEKYITQHMLYTHYNIPRSLLDRLRKNKNIEVYTIDRLCRILDCRVEDILRYVPDEISDSN